MSERTFNTPAGPVTLSPNEVGSQENGVWGWHGVGDYENLNVTMVPNSGKLTVNEMEVLWNEDEDCMDEDCEVVNTHTGDQAIFFLSLRGVKYLLAGAELFEIQYNG